MEEANAIQLYTVNEYVFENKEDYEVALQEKKGIKYLSAQLDLSNSQKVAELYNELIEKHVFSSQIGFDYLRKLRETVAKANPDLIPTMRKIPVASSNHKTRSEMDKYVSNRVEGQLKAMEEKVQKTKEKRRISIIINIVLVLMVIAMFILTWTSSSPTILDYERKLQDKYASWAEELSNKEEKLRERERQLDGNTDATNTQEKSTAASD